LVSVTIRFCRCTSYSEARPSSHLLVTSPEDTDSNVDASLAGLPDQRV
jgi:hypothetical protein